MSRQQIEIECPECSATGLYSGFMERTGEYVICARCGGTGKQTLSYTPFTCRKGRRGVEKVRGGSGMILDDTRNAKWFSYAEFKQKIPSRD